MSYIDEFKKIDSNTATGAATFFFSMLGPGFLTVFLFGKTYFIDLETLKVVFLSLSISMPGVILPIFVSHICATHLIQSYGKSPVFFGNMKDWYYRSAISNAINMYLLLFVCYVFNLDVLVFSWGYFASILLCVGFEFRYMIKKSIDPEKYPTIPAP